MGRASTKATAPAEMPEVLPAVAQNIEQAQHAVTRLDREADEILAAGVDLGRLEALDFIAVTANTASLAVYESVKKSKAWRYLRNPQSADSANFETLEQFCDVKLGKSYRRLQTLLGQKSLIGQQAFEQGERIGLRDVDYNAIKSLPAPEHELIRRAVEEAQSRDEVLDLLQELAARHAKEKEASAKEAKQLKQDNSYTAELLQKERERAEVAEKQLRSGDLKARPLKDQVDPFLGEIKDRQKLLVTAVTAHIEATNALDAWWTQMVSEAPDYDPMQAVDMPREVALVAVELDDSAARLAQLVGTLQHELQQRFGDELGKARQYLMQEPEAHDA